MDAPILLKILVSLALILVSNKLLKNLSYAVLLGTLTLALWSGHSLAGMAEIAGRRFLSLDNGALLVVIFFVIWLSSQMDKTGVMRDLVENIRSYLSPRSAMAVLPAVIGLLPMPGGALFSAPLVDDCDTENQVPAQLKSQVNYWFRHIWEFFWPLYPGVILAMELADLEVHQMLLIGSPMVLTMIAGGYFFILRRVHLSSKRGAPSEHHVLSLLSPILILILIYALIMVFFPSLSHANKYLPMIIGLSGAMGLLQLQRPLGWGQWKSIFLSSRALNMGIIVALIRIYGAFIEARLPSGVLLMEQMRVELDSVGIPIVLLVMLISFISGLTTGVSLGFVGASLPIAFSLLGADADLSTRMGILAMTYPFGFIGIMLSPVHVCFIVTSEHFKTSLLRSMGRILPPSALILLIASILGLVLL